MNEPPSRAPGKARHRVCGRVGKAMSRAGPWAGMSPTLEDPRSINYFLLERPLVSYH